MSIADVQWQDRMVENSSAEAPQATSPWAGSATVSWEDTPDSPSAMEAWNGQDLIVGTSLGLLHLLTVNDYPTTRE